MSRPPPPAASESPPRHLTRRRFVGAAATFGFQVVRRHVIGGPGVTPPGELLNLGVIGDVTEIHAWSDRPGHFWDTQGKSFPAETPPVPANLDWDLWIGPSQPVRPYHPDYCPRKWRGWWQFGCGALGDMAVHNADPAFYALDLGAPDWVDAESAPNNNESFPEWSIITQPQALMTTRVSSFLFSPWREAQ